MALFAGTASAAAAAVSAAAATAATAVGTADTFFTGFLRPVDIPCRAAQNGGQDQNNDQISHYFTSYPLSGTAM